MSPSIKVHSVWRWPIGYWVPQSVRSLTCRFSPAANVSSDGSTAATAKSGEWLVRAGHDAAISADLRGCCDRSNGGKEPEAGFDWMQPWMYAPGLELGV